MTNDLVTVSLDDDVDDVASRMSRAQVRRLPVIDSSHKLCGIVSRSDLTRKGDNDAAEYALEGISEPGGQHQQ